MGMPVEPSACRYLPKEYIYGLDYPIQLYVAMYSGELLLNRVIFNPLMGLHSNPSCLTEPTGVIRARACLRNTVQP